MCVWEKLKVKSVVAKISLESTMIGDVRGRGRERKVQGGM